MEALIEECFRMYLALMPFVERCLTSWQQFSAQHMCQPLTFNKHNYEVLLQQHDTTVQELLEYKQRADKLQASQHHAKQTQLVNYESPLSSWL
jgi:hypothetical protein